ncbi:hypothetical protein KC336_g17904 [Hortaea werneckii]|nr:hypothetical protein KC336_g17904 [Hortaea werneckii]
MLKDSRISTKYCVLDGLDECDEDSQRWLVTKLVELMSVDGSESSNHVFKIAIISRPEVFGLSECAQVRLDPDNDEQVGKDIRTFVSSRVQKLASGVSLSAELHHAVQTELFKRSEGTFLWVGFAMVELLKKKTATEIQRALYSLPKGLPGIYGRMVRQIEEEHRHKSLLILRWITLAFRPLSLLELATAVGTQPPPHVTLTQAVSDQISMCGPLVKVEGKTASLVHQSARDYLLRDKRDDDEVLEWFRIKPNESHTDLAVACVDCLVRSSNQYRKIQEMEPDTELRDAFLAETQEQFPLREYAVEHWPDHAKASSMVETILQRNGRFFVEESPAREVWWQEYSWISWRLLVRSRLPALHVASRLGIPQWAQKLIAKRKKQPLNFLRSRNHVNQRDSDGRTPLWWAAYSGHEAVVRLLLATGKVDANLADFRGETALLAAADAGHEAVVRLLLAASEVDVNPADTYGRTALWFAASRGQEAMVQLLLATGKVDANARISHGGTPLHIAAENGQEAVVQLLLATDKVDINAQDHFNRTPLSVAAENGQEAVVQLLLATDKVDVNALDGFNQTPLSVAAENGEEAVVQLLLATDKVDVDAKDLDGRTPLSLALAEGHKEVVQLLQEHSRRHYKSEEE